MRQKHDLLKQRNWVGVIKMCDERLKFGRIVGVTHVNFNHECPHKNQSNHGQEHDGSNDTNGLEHL